MKVVTGLWRSTIGKKIAMALTGLLLVGFLISHMISNVLVFVDGASLDLYAAWLRGFGPLLWIPRLILLGAVVIHIVAAFQLSALARAGRGGSYRDHDRPASTYASRTMRWGGVLILVFIIFHILHYTIGIIHPDFRVGEVGRNLVRGMESKPVALFYLVSMIALGAHLLHGIWSVFQTLGINHPTWNRWRRGIAIGLTVLVAGGFASIPAAALLGWLR